MATQDNSDLSIGEYLIRGCRTTASRDVFGIPGDYVLSFYTMLEQSPLDIVGCTREDCAGFAADAYARVHGMGALCVTYCVGGLSVCNSIAGAYAEKSPVVMITGSPGLRERIHNPLLHHMVRNFRTQYDVFEKLCVAGTELDDPLTAFSEIDRVLADVRPLQAAGVHRDSARHGPRAAARSRRRTSSPSSRSDPRALAEAVDEAVAAHRNGPAAGDAARASRSIASACRTTPCKLAEESGIPMAATMLGKGVVAETHPLYMGLYEGAIGREEVTQYVEASDCVLMLGTFMTDINLGIYTAELDLGDCIYATSEQLPHSASSLPRRAAGRFHASAGQRGIRGRRTRRRPRRPTWTTSRSRCEPTEPITITRLIDRLDEQLDDDTIVIADVGDALFAATELTTHGKTEFLSPAYYTSMGFAVPAALGVHVARPDARVVAIVGDGAFQMTGMELSTLVRHKLPDRRDRARQRRLRHRAAAAPGRLEVQRHPALAVPQAARGARRRHGLPDPHRRRIRRGAQRRLERPQRPEHPASHLDRKDCSRALARLAERMSKTVVQK